MSSSSRKAKLAESDETMKSKDALSLKRGRETSLMRTASLLDDTDPQEPSAEPHVTPSTTLKKNRLDADEADRTSPIPEDPPVKVAETKTVTEVRRKVEKMSHTEGAEAGSSADLERDASAEGTEVKEKDLKRKAIERSESSAAVENDAKRVKDTPSPPKDAPIAAPASASDTAPTAPSIPPPTAATAKKPQATFGAFTSTASPFAKSSAASSSGSSAFGSSSAGASAFSSSGFGGFSGSASPFASKTTSAFGAAPASSGLGSSGKKAETAAEDDDEGEEKEAGAEDVEKGGKAAFDDILAGAGDEEEVKDKPQMTEKDVVTGEEDEYTKFQMRTKLYVMQSDNSWRERGVGVLRLNVRRGDGHGARLVIRAEGVLRLILNVSLYVGQTCLEDGKHVRTTVFEDGERRFVTFRTGSVKAAQELAGHIQEYIPLESQASKSPQPAEVSAEEGATGGW